MAGNGDRLGDRMADKLADLVLRIRADSKQLSAELAKVEASNARTTKKVESQWRDVSAGISGAFGKLRSLPGIGGIVAGAAGVLSVSGIASLADEAQDAASEIDDLSARLGISTTALQEYQFAASQAGLDQGALVGALQKFGKSVGEAALGTGRARTSLEALGVSVRDAGGDARSLDAVFEDVVLALSRVNDASLRTALSQRIFGESGAAIAALSLEFNELVQRAQAFGIAIDKNVIAALASTQDASETLSAVLDQRLSKSLAVFAGLTLAAKKEAVGLAERLMNVAQAVGLIASAQHIIPPEAISDVSVLDSRIAAATEQIEKLNAEAERLRGGRLKPRESSSGILDQLSRIRVDTNEARRELEALQRQRSKLTEAPASSGGLEISSTALSTKSGLSAAAKKEARELAKAQSDLSSVIDASRTPAEKLIAQLDDLGEHYRAGKLSAEQYAEGQSAIERQLSEIDAEVRKNALQKLNQFLESGQTQAERVVSNLEEITGLYRDGTITAEEFAQAQESAAKQLGEIDTDPMKKALEDLESIGKGVFEGLTGALADFVMTGQLNLQSFAQSFAREFLQLGIKAGAVGLFSGLGIPIAGALASGGPVLPGRPYLVGEDGPELVIPKQAGYVLPSVSRGAPAGATPFAMSGGAPVYVTVNNSSRAGVDVNQRTGPSGQREIEILVTDVIARDIGRGGPVGRSIDKRLGVRPRGV